MRDAAKECMVVIFGSECDVGSDVGMRMVGGCVMEGFGDGCDVWVVESGVVDVY